MTPAAVVFDFYGTLTPGRSGAEQAVARREQASALGVDQQRFDAELSATFDERSLGAGDDVAGSLAWVTRRIGVEPSPEQLEHAARVRLAGERRFGEPREEAAAVLRALEARGLRLGLISNCSAELPAYFPDLAIARYFDAAVFSFTSRRRKPDPAIYLECCAALEVAPQHCVFVGDGGSDELAGARRVGMRPVHLAVPGERASIVYGRHASWDGETITALPEVLDFV